MEIFWAELGYSLKFLWAVQSQGVVLPFNEVQKPELLDCPVHVDDRKPTCVGYICLRERKSEAAIVRQPYEFHASGKLTKKMRDSTQGLA
jgi:hypothetical protein